MVRSPGSCVLEGPRHTPGPENQPCLVMSETSAGDHAASSAEVPHGSSHVPQLCSALPKPAPPHADNHGRAWINPATLSVSVHVHCRGYIFYQDNTGALTFLQVLTISPVSSPDDTTQQAGTRTFLHEPQGESYVPAWPDFTALVCSFN